jgi:hypothetical protein
MADDRTYIRVHDGMDEHPKVEPLSDGAFRLLMRSWFYCSRNRTDGRMPDAIWKKRGTAKARAELLAAGLAEQHEGYVEMHDYLEHQRSAEEIRLLKEHRGDTGTLGNHIRWHVVRRKPKEDCEHCQNDPGSDRKRIANAIANGSQTDRKPIASTEAEAETEDKNSSRGGSHVSSGTASPPLPRFPDHCTAHANNPTPGKCGDCADTRKARAAAADTLPNYRLRVVPPLCGHCDERWIETPDGLTKCPNCYPQEVAS